MFKVECVSSTNGLKRRHTYNLFKFFIFYMYNKETSSWDFFLNFYANKQNYFHKTYSNGLFDLILYPAAK